MAKALIAVSYNGKRKVLTNGDVFKCCEKFYASILTRSIDTLPSTPPPMPLADRTNLSTGAHLACPPHKLGADRPRALPRSQAQAVPNPLRRLPTNEAELAQRLLEEPDFIATFQPLYKVVSPFALLHAYLALGCYHVNPSLQPTTSTKRVVTLGLPRNRKYYGASLPKYIPRIKFFKNGVPGPFLKELLEASSGSFNFVDDFDDVVVERNIEQKTYFQIDVRVYRIVCFLAYHDKIPFQVALRGNTKTMV